MKPNNKNLWARIKRYSFAYYFLLPTLLAMLFLHFSPIVQAIYMSFLKLNQLTLQQYLLAPFAGFDNFYKVLLDPQSTIRIGLFEAVRNTVIYTIVVTLGTVAVGMIVALMLNRKFFGRTIIRTLFLFPWIVPTYVTGLLWGIMWLKGGGIINVLLYDVIKFHFIAAKLNIVIRFLRIDKLISIINFIVNIFIVIYHLLLGYIGTLSISGQLLLSIFIIMFLIFAYILILKFVKQPLKASFISIYLLLLAMVLFNIKLPTAFSTTYKVSWLSGVNTIWAIIIPTIWRYWPLSMLMLLAGLQTIPEELYEAADIDGANPWHKFWMITWPMLRPVWFILILFGLIYNTYSFNIVIMMFGFGAGYPGEWGDLMMTNIFRNSFQLWNFGTGAATSVLLLIVMIIIVNIWFRYFKKAEELR